MITIDALREEIQTIQQRRQELQSQRDALEKELGDLDDALNIVHGYLVWKSKELGEPLPDDAIVTTTENSKPLAPSLSDVIIELFARNPAWKLSDRRTQYETILNQLRLEAYDFGDNNKDYLSVNMALTKALKRMGLYKQKKAKGGNS